MEILVGDYEVYKSGTVIGVKGQPMSFHIENLIITFEFVTDSEQPKLTVKTDIISSTHLKLIFINFDDTLGAGNIKPVRLGNLGEKGLYLQYRIYTLREDAGKLVHYTWLLNKKLNKGDVNGEESK